MKHSNICIISATEVQENKESKSGKCEIKYEEIIAGNAPHLKEEIDWLPWQLSW